MEGKGRGRRGKRKDEEEKEEKEKKEEEEKESEDEEGCKGKKLMGRWRSLILDTVKWISRSDFMKSSRLGGVSF